MKLRISLSLKAEDGLAVSQFESKSMLARRITLSSAIGFLAALLITAPRPANAQIETVLHSFAGSPDGSASYGKLTRGPKGSFYGTTSLGGVNSYGTVFKITRSGTETVLYSFAGIPDGAYPAFSPVAFDKAGNLYGTTYAGGANGNGTVFKLTPSGTETVLYSFAGGVDGYQPNSGVILDKLGNLYGTTVSGGLNGYGTVFKITPSGTKTVLYSFTGGIDGCFPYADGLFLGKKNVLYGTTVNCGGNGVGTVYELTLSGTETTLHTFQTDGIDGNYPYAGVVVDKAGNIYGTTEAGGTNNAGTFYKITPTGNESVLHHFAGNGTDGAYPYGAVAILDKLGNLYGTTNGGGTYGCGTVFKISSSGTETILYSFNPNGVDGYSPTAALALGKENTLYGTTLSGGANTAGTVFKLVP